jgi:hypothetical protein
MNTTLKIGQVQLEHFMRERKATTPPSHFLPTFNLTGAKLLDNQIIFYGLFHRGNALITEVEDGLELNISVKPYWFLHALFAFIVMSFGLYLFGNHLVVNGDGNPAFTTRLIYFLSSTVFFLIPYALVVFGTKRFLHSIMKEFEN